ncbi:MAG: T9SS type A sorting domain-containing protein [Bacteroidetes bacterium]|nr:T9SS type A sorting domain-containing protein [Bacteroidota bacterium]MCW5897612.1 T9SS type A sorting domain-containing protein [Bacteroidota bacterium]
MKRIVGVTLSLIVSLIVMAEHRSAAQMFSDSIGFRLFEDDGQDWSLKVPRDTVWNRYSIPLSAFGNGSGFLDTSVTKFVVVPIGGGGLIGGPYVEVVDWIDHLSLADSLIDDFDDGDYSDWFLDIATNGSYLRVTSSSITPDTSVHCMQLAHGNTMGQSFAGYVEKRFTGLFLAPTDTLRLWLRGKISPVAGAPQTTNGVPPAFALHQNYPNPFNPATTINYQLAAKSHVTLKVFDILGREVAMLVNEVQYPGFKSVLFNASGVASGVYLYRMATERFTQTRTLVLFK